MNKAIALSNISFQYKRADRPALDRISWSLNPGECAVIMGPSASGKTTLCRSLNGLIPQALEGRLTGDIRVAGKNVKRFRVQTMAKDIGFVMQDPETQIVGRTVFEDLAFGPKNFLVPALEIKKRIPKALSYMGLEGYENRSTAELSGGEKQRIAIAGILAMEPSILVLDDPASELDPKGRANLYAHLNRLKHSRGLTLVIVEQKIEDLMFIADQAVVMKKGKIVFQGSPEQVPRPIIPELFNSRTNESKTMDSPLLLTVRDLNFGFTQAAPVLKHINLELRQKDFIALMGHNGAGKTTLVKHLNGLICAHPGTIQFCGKDLSTMTIKERARFVGFVFQNPDHQIFETSVEKEIAFGLAGQGLSKEKITQRVDQTLAETGLEPFRQRHPFTLGKGMRQVIAVASIVALNPQVLVVDEPTTGLDPEGSRHIMDLIARLHDQGTAIVLITHDLSLAAGYARRLVVMNQGKIILDREMSADLHTHPALQAAGLIPSKKEVVCHG